MIPLKVLGHHVSRVRRYDVASWCFRMKWRSRDARGIEDFILVCTQRLFYFSFRSFRKHRRARSAREKPLQTLKGKWRVSEQAN